ncbi:MAG: anthranilate phosphoribosyltransferase, partial [Actinobacteria bacterium]|nr:anthranilate phosphoribosyltransferase [Actinomycetota bacterium]
ETLARLGSKHVVAFHGDRGLDELATSGPSRVVELKDGATSEWTIDPAELGLDPAPLEAIAGGDAAENAAAIRALVAGEKGPKRDVVVLNAAAGLIAAGRVDEMVAGLAMAAESIDSGGASRVLDLLIEASNDT